MKVISKRAIISSILLPILMVGMLGWWIFGDLPRLNNMEDYKPYLINEVYDASNHLVAEFFIERRSLVHVQTLPEHVKNAFIAAEDAEFYSHQGLDYFGILRAVANEVRYKLLGGRRLGGSTITQQTAKTMLLSRKRTYTRKLREMLLAKQMEDKFSKNEILNMYLNQIYFGNGVYGIEEAAQLYYGRAAKDLSLAQAATLAGVPKSPNRINPINNAARAEERRAYVLDQMADKLFVSHLAAEQAKQEPVTSNHEKVKKQYLDQAPYYTEQVRKMMIEVYGKEGLYRGGFKIYTALNLEFQNEAERALKNGLKNIDKRQGYHGPQVRFKPEKLEDVLDDLALAKSIMYANDANKNKMWNLRPLTKKIIEESPDTIPEYTSFKTPEINETTSALVLNVDDDNQSATIDLGNGLAALNFNNVKWARDFSTEIQHVHPKKISQVLHVGDIIPVKITKLEPEVEVTLFQNPKVEGAIISIDPENHHVLALVGGFDHHLTKFNRATQARRQPGSAFKPLLYAHAIDLGLATPASIITDAPKVFLDEESGSQWKPKNDSGIYLGDITLRTCLMKSINTCSISLLERMGVKTFHKFAEKINLHSKEHPMPNDLTLALGSADLIPIDVINAWSIFPNGGRYTPPIMITHITDLKDNLIYENAPEEIQVIRPQTAFLATQILKDVVKRGGSRKVRDLPFHIAGKTGSTNELRSTWFIGFSPHLVTGVYVGFDNNDTMGPREYAHRTALPIWKNFMRQALKEYPNDDFAEPEGIEWKLIDEKSGLLSKKSLLEKYVGDLETDEVPISVQQAPDGTLLEAFEFGSAPSEYATEGSDEPLELLYESGGL